MQYAITGGIMLNDILYADGREKKGLLGGGGLYALTGIKLWTDDCHFIGNIGEDFDVLAGPWWDANKIPREGLNTCHKHCVYHQVNYHPDGRFEEYSLYDEGPRHDNYMIYRPEQLERYAKDLKGFSIVGAPNPVELRKVASYKEKYGFKVMLELNTFYCRDMYVDTIKECLPYLDMYSLNRPEAMNLFGVDTEEDCIENMIRLGIPCFFRVGKKGSYMVMNGEAVFCPIVIGENDIDPTGCGNSSTAAALYAFCEGYDAKKIAIMANVTSCMNAQQFGPMPLMDEALRKKAWKMVDKLHGK